MMRFGENSGLSAAPFLLEVREEEDQMLRLRIAPARRGRTGEGAGAETDPKLQELLAQAVSLGPDPERGWEICFETYALYLVRRESCTMPEGSGAGDYFLRFAQSRLLDSAPALIDRGYWEALSGRPCSHYGIRCQDHVIDVLTTQPPVIREYHAL